MRISDWSSDVCSSDLSFKPKPLRYANHMADTACHVLRSTTRLGLTLALGPKTSTFASPKGAYVSPKQLVQEWVSRFNAGDIAGLASLYTRAAVNNPFVIAPLNGRAAIRQMFELKFGR